VSRDPLAFPGYRAALDAAAAESGVDESVEAGPAAIAGHEVEYARFNFTFFGGSMGEVAGERLARAMERAAAAGKPFVLETATGGARMQEGMRSLAQMPKVVVARCSFAGARQPFIAVFRNPTTGGVLASLGGLADVTVAEEGATVGFAGPRVAAAFMGRALRGTSHTAESAFAAGLVDEVVEPGSLKDYVAGVLETLAADQPVDGAAPRFADGRDLDPWETVEAARAADRPLAHELLLDVADSLVVLHGDRSGAMDFAVDVAIARIAGRRAVVFALDRKRSPGPTAYRKARRAVALAGRLRIPIVSIIDTRGADPSEDSERGGIAWELAQLFESMLNATVPTLAIVTGEGGSGGALAFACTDTVLAYESSIFSVIGPELAAEILWRDGSRAPDAARALKLTASHLKELGIADAVLAEPLDARSLRAAITYHLGRLNDRDATELVARRKERWRGNLGD